MSNQLRGSGGSGRNNNGSNPSSRPHSRDRSRNREPKFPSPPTEQVQDIASNARPIFRQGTRIPSFPIEDNENNHYGAPPSPDRHEDPRYPHADCARRITYAIFNGILSLAPSAVQLKDLDPNAHDLGWAIHMTSQMICLKENRAQNQFSAEMKAQWSCFLDIGHQELEKCNTSALRTLMVLAWGALVHSRALNPNDPSMPV